MRVLHLIFGIYEALKTRNIDCILISEDNIFKGALTDNIGLVDKDGLKTTMRGFIGGASCVIDGKFILFGDIDYLRNKDTLVDFVKKYGLELVYFDGLEINDYGGIVILA